MLESDVGYVDEWGHGAMALARDSDIKQVQVRRHDELALRTHGRRAGDRPASETAGTDDQQLPPISAEDLDRLIGAVEQIASVLPDGHEVFTAISDLRGRASDLVMRDHTGETRVVLGLSEAQNEHVGPLLSRIRESIAEDDPAAPAREPTVAVIDARPVGDLSYRTIVEHSPVPLMVICADGTIEYASGAIVPTLGMQDPSQLSGTAFAELVHPADRDRLARIALQGLNSRAITVRLLRWDGGYVTADVVTQATPERDRLILALTRSSAHRLGFEEVFSAERRQRALADAADCGTALVNALSDGFGSVIDCNAMFGRIVGHFAGELAGHPISDLVAAGDEARVREALRRVSAGVGTRTLQVRLATNVHRRAEFVISADRSSGDPPTQLTIRVRDVTEQQGFVGELHRSVERLERDNRELAEFARVTAHDLMSPLRAISGLVDLLAPSLEERSTDALSSLQNAIERMLAMIDSAIGFAAARSQELERASVDLNAVLGHVQATLAADIAAANASITADELPTVSGDAAQLERLLQCLLSNALAYAGDAAPQVHLSATRDGEMWRVMVADHGIGVEADARERIFGLFERQAAAAASSGGSRGIGLATCRRIVELHDGRIWVQPNLPRGSIFAFTLPGADL